MFVPFSPPEQSDEHQLKYTLVSNELDNIHRNIEEPKHGHHNRCSQYVLHVHNQDSIEAYALLPHRFRLTLHLPTCMTFVSPNCRYLCNNNIPSLGSGKYPSFTLRFSPGSLVGRLFLFLFFSSRFLKESQKKIKHIFFFLSSPTRGKRHRAEARCPLQG